MIVRFAGVALIAICGIAIHFLYEMVHSGPLHQPTIAEFALALVVVVTGLGGMLMAATGSELTSWKHR